MKSPLRYPGGKSRYIKKILPHIPTDKVLISPFFGGGHIELACLARGQRVIGGDAFFPLVNFWMSMAISPEKVIPYVKDLYSSKDLDFAFLNARNIVQTDDSPWAAANYFLINRCSFSGATLSGGFSRNAAEKRFTKSSIERLEKLDLTGLYIRLGDFMDTLSYCGSSSFVYADPPYYEIQGLYGKNGDMSFSKDDHETLASSLLNLAQTPFAISYNDCPEIRNLYDGCQFIELMPSKSMSNGKKSCPEILILSR